MVNRHALTRLDAAAARKGIGRGPGRFGCLAVCAAAWISGSQAYAMRAYRREHLLAQRAAICDKRWFHPPLGRAGCDRHLSSILLKPHYSFSSSLWRLTCMEWARSQAHTYKHARKRQCFFYCDIWGRMWCTKREREREHSGAQVGVNKQDLKLMYSQKCYFQCVLQWEEKLKVCIVVPHNHVEPIMHRKHKIPANTSPKVKVCAVFRWIIVLS